jgi:hypothetical protein
MPPTIRPACRSTPEASTRGESFAGAVSVSTDVSTHVARAAVASAGTENRMTAGTLFQSSGSGPSGMSRPNTDRSVVHHVRSAGSCRAANPHNTQSMMTEGVESEGSGSPRMSRRIALRAGRSRYAPAAAGMNTAATVSANLASDATHAKSGLTSNVLETTPATSAPAPAESTKAAIS